MKKVKIRVVGRVQGVGFRYMTKLVADEIGVTGIVKNEDDGSVYIEAVGPNEKIEAFIKAIKKSPSPSGRVDACNVAEDDAIENYLRFRITN
ncbi:acylphosphatase signature 1 [Trichococcus palustris]|uniref:acylphosphatase n=1 Tax=Trichococcus palustris TaxID=140314 RepID=A0A143Y6U1_9LACT|nr:acylphosphatase [Trichococcus palustris]CZQ83230.1 acylphosphatase signature 1 [Trichococcus palustris]SFK69339.1 acylphosphatase [Trichococcus palustris]